MLNHLLLTTLVFPGLITAAEVSIQLQGSTEPIKYAYANLESFNTIKSMYEDIGSGGIIPLAHVTKKQFDILVGWINNPDHLIMPGVDKRVLATFDEMKEKYDRYNSSPEYKKNVDFIAQVVKAHTDKLPVELKKVDPVHAVYKNYCTYRSTKLFELLIAANYLDAPSHLKDFIGAHDAHALQYLTPAIALFNNLPGELHRYIAPWLLYNVLKNGIFNKEDLVEAKEITEWQSAAIKRPAVSNSAHGRDFVCIWNQTSDGPLKLSSSRYMHVDFAQNQELSSQKLHQTLGSACEHCVVSPNGYVLFDCDLNSNHLVYLQNLKNTSEVRWSGFGIDTTSYYIVAALFNKTTNKFNVVVNKKNSEKEGDKSLCVFEIDPTIEPNKPLSATQLDRFDIANYKQRMPLLCAEEMHWSCINGDLIGVSRFLDGLERRDTHCLLYSNNKLLSGFLRDNNGTWMFKAEDAEKEVDVPFSLTEINAFLRPVFAIQKSFIPHFEELVSRKFSGDVINLHIPYFDTEYLQINGLSRIPSTRHNIKWEAVKRHAFPPALMASISFLNKKVQKGEWDGVLASAFRLNRQYLNPDGWQKQCEYINDQVLPEIKQLHGMEQQTTELGQAAQQSQSWFSGFGNWFSSW
jgi:hypothetical protein